MPLRGLGFPPIIPLFDWESPDLPMDWQPAPLQIHPTSNFVRLAMIAAILLGELRPHH